MVENHDKERAELIERLAGLQVFDLAEFEHLQDMVRTIPREKLPAMGLMFRNMKDADYENLPDAMQFVARWKAFGWAGKIIIRILLGVGALASAYLAYKGAMK